MDISKIPKEVWTESGVTSQEYSSALIMDKADILRRHLKVDVPYVIFGHIGDNHLHFNFLPESGRELTEVKIAYMRLARKGVELGGTISGEHGVGKKVYEEGGDKKHYLEVLYGRKGLEEIALLKHKLDPNHILNVGNIVPIKYLNKLN